jgi:two-component system, OmpR family, sensor kinase
MVCVLAVSGVVIFDRVRSQVDHRLDTDVNQQARALLAQGSQSGLVHAVKQPRQRPRSGVAEVLDDHGHVLAATPGLGNVSLLTHSQLKIALRRRLLSDRHNHKPLRDGLRLVSTPIQLPGHGSGVLVVGSALDQRTVSLTSLTVAMLIVGPIALLIVVVVGYRITAAALRPVELMRRQAAMVQAAEPGVRLPLPPADDEVRQLGLTLNAMLDRLEASLARERAFVANVSHELRTPLSNMKAELDLALRRPRPAEELLEALRSTQVEVDRLSAVAEDMLVLASADEDRFSITAERLSVSAIVDGVRERFAHNGQTIAISGTAEGQTIVADPRRIEQALVNLVDNALRYGEGQVELAVATNGGGMVELHVRDEGPGFPAEFLDHAFERFSRADPGRAGRGAGLGLSIVRMIARTHGGDAHVANGERGADAWMVIPGLRDA